MKDYKVVITQEVYNKLVEIALYIDSFNIYPAGLKYINALEKEIRTLSYRADTIPEMNWKPRKKLRKNTRRLLVKNHRFAVLFHTFQDYVIVDDIIPASMLFLN
ncbi:MAG: hypothetical protein II817_08050 [Bacteroidales bacterium]|nr:hypothetical protein [Bacteroidales bacterium]